MVEKVDEEDEVERKVREEGFAIQIFYLKKEPGKVSGCEVPHAENSHFLPTNQRMNETTNQLIFLSVCFCLVSSQNNIIAA